MLWVRLPLRARSTTLCDKVKVEVHKRGLICLHQRLNEPLKIGANLPLFHDSAHFYCQIDKNVCSFPTYHAHCYCGYLCP
jgi:hypothetical protein